MQRDPAEIKSMMARMTPEQRALLDAYLHPSSRVWHPLAGPQQHAYLSPADIVFFGGQGGGGKTDLSIGLALTQHRRSLVMRREGTQLRGIIDRLEEIMGGRDGFNENTKVWRLGSGRFIELGSAQRLGDEEKYQGRPHDLLVLDEVTHFAESQLRFLVGWLRTNDPTQRCRVLLTGNPPIDSDGEWVIDFFAPWLDQDHPKPAKPGELRWFVTVQEGSKDIDREVDGPGEVIVNGERLTPMSRTFIPASVHDNPFLIASGYDKTLQSLPTELRDRIAKGLFIRTGQGSPFQIIQSSWVEASFDRWKNQPKPNEPMTGVGVDVARGGPDETIISRRHGNWYDELLAYPGVETPDGQTAAALVVDAIGDQSPAIGVDVIGYGSSCFDHLQDLGAEALNGSEGTKERDRHGRLGFANKRALWWWRLREALDPENGATIALPPDPQLRKDLLTVRWKLTSKGIQVESKEEIYARLRRSPDRADAVVYALAVEGEIGPSITVLG